MDEIESLDLYENCDVSIVREWLPKSRADKLFHDIQVQIPFGFYEITYMGKVYNVPRGIFCFGDDGICTNDVHGNVVDGIGHTYGRPAKKYMSCAWNTPIDVLSDEIDVPPDCSQPIDFSYLSSIAPNKKDKPVGASINKIKEHINNTTGLEFNAVLLNAYRDGKDSISAHSDKEVKPPNNEVYGISLGDSRIIHFISLDGQDKHKIEMRHGDLMIMSGETQSYYKHEIRKQANKGLRVSLTFRNLA